MDRSAVKAIVDKNITPLLKALGLPHWKIRISYDGCPDSLSGVEDATADCVRLLDYEQASIRLDPTKLDDEKEVLFALRHELFHVVASPVDLLSNLLTYGLSGLELERTERVIQHAIETTIRNLERMWWGCELHWKRKREAGKASPKPKAKGRAVRPKVEASKPKAPSVPLVNGRMARGRTPK
jgi:hypothetical protein